MNDTLEVFGGSLAEMRTLWQNIVSPQTTFAKHQDNLESGRNPLGSQQHRCRRQRLVCGSQRQPVTGIGPIGFARQA